MNASATFPPHAVLLSSAYLAPVEYYAHMLASGRVLLEQYDHYRKQTYRNRCAIAAPDGPLVLTVPVVKPSAPKAFMRDIRISDHGNWRHLHWNAFETAYNHTPFFEYYRDDFRPFYERRYEFLADFNEELLHLVCSLIDMQPVVSRTTAYAVHPAAGVLDLREAICPKEGTPAEGPAFSPVPYYQVFASRLGFLPNLSIVDLLFNMGPESLLVLQQSMGIAAKK